MGSVRAKDHPVGQVISKRRDAVLLGRRGNKRCGPLGCVHPRYRIAAAGPAAVGHDQRPFDWCPDPRPVPLIRFHGGADPVVPHEGGKSRASPNPFANVAKWTASWARRNRCAPVPARTEVAPDVTLIEYKDCALPLQDPRRARRRRLQYPTKCLKMPQPDDLIHRR